MSATVTVRLPQWLARNEGYASRELRGEVLSLTDKGVRLRAHAVVRPSDHCLRCGREIVNPVSKLAGYGPDCSEYLGIPRDFTEDQLDEIRRVVEARVVEVWLPRLRIEVLNGALEVSGTNGDQPKPTAKLAVVRDRIHVHAPFAYKDALKGVTGARWDGTAKAWTYPASAHAAEALADVFRGQPLDIEADDEIKALRAQAAHHVEAAAHKLAEELPPVPCSATDAWLHQRQAYWFVEGLPAAMLAMDMGTGKSKVAVDGVVNAGDNRTLIICPKSVVGVWPREFARHAGRPVKVCAPRKGPRGGELNVTKRAEEIEHALRTTPADQPLVVVVNYESAWRPQMEKVLVREWDQVILDESHRIKKPGGKASMFCAKLRAKAARRRCLTGTPMPHSPLDIYAQYRFLDPGIFGTSFVAFRNRYAVMGGFENKQVVAFQRQDELAERMYRVAFRVMAGDVLDLPGAVHVPRETMLGPEGRKVYEALSGQLVADVRGGIVSASNVLTRLLRLQQVTSGWLPLDDPDEEGNRQWVEIDTAKRDLLADVIEDLPEREPIVVACRFTADLDNVRWVAEQQGRRYAELSGRRRDGLAEDATMSTECDVLGVQIQSGGTGIDLTRAHYAVNYSVGYSLGDWDQWLKRTDRPGQTHGVTFLNLACEDTIDGEVYQALIERRALVDFVLGLAN